MYDVAAAIGWCVMVLGALVAVCAMVYGSIWVATKTFRECGLQWEFAVWRHSKKMKEKASRD